MIRRLPRDDNGAAMVEFALAAPAILMFIVGVAQLGMLCMANAGLGSAVAEGARAASVFPTPDEDQPILDRIEAAQWGMMDDYIVEPEITREEDENGCGYIDITMGYQVPLNFIFFDVGPVTLTENRRVWMQSQEDCDTAGSSSTSTSTSSGSTSTGSTSTSASSTSTGSTSTSASSTSTSSTSTGGSTSTSASSTSTGSTSTSASSTSTGSSSNGSSGNGSSGHSHGNGSSSNGNGSSGNH